MFKKQPDPEDPEVLSALTPRRRYTRDEVESFMQATIGLVNDGLPLVWQSPIVEMPLWYKVEVAYDDKTTELAYETWYFFKHAEEE